MAADRLKKFKHKAIKAMRARWRLADAVVIFQVTPAPPLPTPGVYAPGPAVVASTCRCGCNSLPLQHPLDLTARKACMLPVSLTALTLHCCLSFKPLL